MKRKKKPTARTQTSKRKQPTKKKQSEVKAARRRRVVAGLIAGKSMRQAALDAGHTQSMADNAGEKILPGLIDEFREALARKIPNAKLVQRIAEGLNAKETKLAQYEGEYTDERYLVSWSERRRYAELACKLRGLLIEKIEVGQSEEAPLNFELNVRFVDPEDKIQEAAPPDIAKK